MPEALAARVPPVDRHAARAARAHLDALAKPPGSLGELEAIAERLAAIAGVSPPPVPGRPHLLVCAADHGVVDQGVTRWPREVTAAMVGQLLDGGAAASVLAHRVGATVTVLDVGVATPTPPRPGLLAKRVRPGTADLALGPAMTHAEAAEAVHAGARAAGALLDAGADVLAVGDMGIGNTTPAAALICAVTGASAGEVVGPGAASGAAIVARKRQVVAAAVQEAGAWVGDGLGVLARLGGLEHAAMAGAMLACAARRIPVVLDGVNADAAALVAVALCPALAGYLIAGHASAEPGAAVALERLGLRPVLRLGMALGEGTGALLAMPVIQSAAAVMHRMARLEQVT